MVADGLSHRADFVDTKACRDKSVAATSGLFIFRSCLSEAVFRPAGVYSFITRYDEVSQ